MVVEQAGNHHDRQQQLADFFFGVFKPGRFTQEHAFHKADAPAAQVRIVRLVAEVEVARDFRLVVAGQLAGDVGFELDQGGFDFGALFLAAVVRRLGEQGVDPLALVGLLGADRQGGQVTVGRDVVQGLVVQLVGVEEGLQAGQLLGEGHRGLP